MLRNDRGILGLGDSWRGAAVLVGGALLVAIACGNSKKDPIIGDGPTAGTGHRGGFAGTQATGGRGGSGGTAGSDGGAGNGGDGPTDPLGPVVEITSPEALARPSDGSVLVEDTVAVVCRAARSSSAGSEAVDPSSVHIEMFDEDGTSRDLQNGDETGRADEYSATFALTGLPNGVVSFKCTASDLSVERHAGSAEISSFVDRGPAIEIVSPAEDSVYPQRGSVDFEFVITADPLVRNDPEAAIDTVTLGVGSASFELVEGSEAGHYLANIDVVDDFDSPLDGSVPVVVQATNGRSDPGPVTRTTSYAFIVDGEGPVITITDPGNQQVRGNKIAISFSAVDMAAGRSDATAGVKLDTVEVDVNRATHHFMEVPTEWRPPMGADFVFTFDSRLVTDSTVQATITVKASDNAGNPGMPASLLIYFDNVPPIVDLDPPKIREMTGTNPVICSYPFDPLGDSANDVTNVTPGLRFPRAFVWDETNRLMNLLPRYSGTDQDSVYLYLHNGTGPAIVDTNDDGVCDSIAPDFAREIQLTAVPQQGSAPVGPLATDPDVANPPIPMNLCGYASSQSDDQTRCPNHQSDLVRVTQHDIYPEERVVYGIGSLPPEACTGDPWEITQFAQEGWICLAAKATDRVGNSAVSRPLRLCYDNTNTASVPSCMDLANPPACATCTLPPAFTGPLTYKLQ